MLLRILAVTLLLSVTVRAQAVRPGPIANTPTFEAASIRESNPSDGRYGWQVLPGNRFRATNMTLHALVRYAYGARYENVHGPGWLHATRYDVDANAPGSASEPSPDTVRLMLRSLLVDRFKLVVSRRAKGTPGFVLTRVGSSLGPSMKASTSDCTVERAREGSTSSEAKSRCQISAGGDYVSGVGQPVAVLANALRVATGSLVTDKTGLTGLYDFALTWTSGNLPERPTASKPPADGGSIFTAVREQLGLQLQARESEEEVIVVERIERPSAN